MHSEPAAISNADALGEVRRWYEATVDSITRAWEPRFRFRQFRPDLEDDWEGIRQPPREELESALAALPLLRDGAAACLVLAVTPQQYEDAQAVRGQATFVMAQDALAHAERLGYFAPACPESLRFPDLPVLEDRRDDVITAERELESLRNCAAIAGGMVERDTLRGGTPDPEDVAQAAEYRARADALEARLTGMRDGTIPARTEREKAEAWQAERLAILDAYRARLVAAGVDASWVELPRPWELERLEEEEA